MSYFRNLDKVVSSQLFAKPNNLLLRSTFRPVYLQQSNEPSVEHLHSVKALLVTIQTLQQLLATPNSPYAKHIQNDLDTLNQKKEQYSRHIHSFVAKAGLLTGEGIANLYYSAEKLNYSADWLDRNIHHEIPRKYKFMSNSNLKDTIAGLTKYHQDSPYLQRVKDELATRSTEQPIYVKHQANETSKYEYAEDRSNNPLVAAVQSNTKIWKYKLWTVPFKRLLNRGKYVLHSA